MGKFHAIVFALFSVLPGAAQAQFYHCFVKTDREEAYWLTEEYYFSVDRPARKIQVMDWWIQEKYGGPIEAEVSAISDEKFVFSWRMFAMDAKLQRATMIYRATYFRKLDQFTVTAKPMGYVESFLANGTCTQD